MREETYKYWAFISYSHRDQTWAEWLHHALETYRVPRRLVGRDSATGPIPRRLFPVFRDQDELPSSPNLSGAIDEALIQSRYLIVIASPYAAVSKWVDQEIARFRELGRADRILCLIVDGEPHADLQPGRGLLECFPPSLRIQDGIEPIAADLRPGKDGKSTAKLKLIAGLLGLGLDELRRRERRRRILQNLGLVSLTVLSALGLAGLWHMQQHEKREALAQQALRSHIDTVYEKGRQELLAHNQARAAVYLNEAYRLGVNTPALRLMLARAMRIVDSEKLVFEAEAPVQGLRFSPDSRLLVTTGTDDIARVWDTGTASKRLQFPIDSSGVSLVPRFSRDSRLVYFLAAPNNAANGIFKIWDVASGRLLATLHNPPSIDHSFNPFDRGSHRVGHVAQDHAAEIIDLDSGSVLLRLPGAYSVAGFSRDGKRFLTGGEDGEVVVWDADGRRRLQVLVGLHSHIVSVDDTEDGSLVAASARDGNVRAWQLADGRLRLMAGHPSPNPFLIFNIDGSRLMTRARDGTRLWDTLNGQLVYVQQFAGSASNSVDISSSGRWMLSSNSSRLAMQDTQSGFEILTLDGHRGVPEARDISEDDQTLATGGADGRVALWNMPEIPDIEFRHEVDPVRWAAETKPPGAAAVFSHDGHLIATGAGDGRLNLWDASTHRLLHSLKADGKSVDALEFSVDDRRLVSGGHADGVKLWNPASGELLQRLDCGSRRVLTVAVSADGRTVAAAIIGGTTLLWDAASGARIASFDRDQARAGRFTPDGRYFAVGVRQAVKLWDIAQRNFVWSTALGNDPDEQAMDVAAIDVSPDGKRLLVAGYGQRALLLDAQAGRILGKIHDPSAGAFNSVRFNHAGHSAALGNTNGGVLLWWPEEGRSAALQGHAGGARSADFSPDDAFVLSSGGDATAKLWDADGGALLDAVAEHGSPMPEAPYQAAAFSPDGHWVLTGSSDGVFRLWELRRESRGPGQLDALLRCKVPWKLDGENLSPYTPDASACPRS